MVKVYMRSYTAGTPFVQPFLALWDLPWLMPDFGV